MILHTATLALWMTINLLESGVGFAPVVGESLETPPDDIKQVM